MCYWGKITTAGRMTGVSEMFSLSRRLEIVDKVSGLTILPLWKPRPRSRNQTPTLYSFGPPGCGPQDRLRFSGIKPPQADTKNIDPCSKKSKIKEIIAPNGRLITAPNGGTDLATISLINLNSTTATNQEPTQERGTGPQPGPMATKLKQDNQVAKLRLLNNKRNPGPSTILLPLDPSTQFPQPCPSQCPDEPSMENVNLRSPDSPPAVFCPPGVPFGPVHFINYPLKSEYKEYTPEKILELDPLARIQSTIRYN
ncbi:hypothetical protein DSO57_1011636 [Entomophthora muscae]|uniref:Uncharacterized protein n=1 Tax=Entomophthora muscae TaxID=34485 RepID=A0ACC2RKW9_9FUNG|nr:hypothetical protein DSO57_1011636 [Entomophthora muscae]